MMIDLRFLRRTFPERIGADGKIQHTEIKILQHRRWIKDHDPRLSYWTEWEDVPLVDEEAEDYLMQKNEPVLIRQVDNGFLVEPEVEKGMLVPVDEMKVYRSMLELQDFLGVHFDYRGFSLKSDQDA